MQSNSISIGIDLGTTYLCLVYFDQQAQRYQILKFNGKESLPSTLQFNRQGKIIVGQKTENCFSEVKRFIGLHYTDPEVQRDLEMYPFEVLQGPNDSIVLKLTENGKEYVMTPEEVTACLLIHLRRVLEVQVLGGRKCQINTVVTVPSNFKDAQIKATERAIKMAGFHLVQTEREPTAAAYAFQCHRQMRNGKILVFDFGGGTLDLSIIDTNKGVFDVKIPHGDNHFGGIDVDNIIKDELLDILCDEYPDEYKRMFGPKVPPRARTNRLVKLRRQVEEIKIELCQTKGSVLVNFGFISSEYEEVEILITQDMFNEWNEVIYKQSIELIYECLEKNNLEKDDIEKILLVGGTSLIPGLKVVLQNEFPGKIDDSMDPNMAIALGAFQLVQSRMELRDGIVLPTERTCYPIQIKSTVNGNVELKDVIPTGTMIPFRKTIEGKTTRNNQKSVNVEVFENGQLLDTFVVNNLPLKHAGVCRFEVIFEMNSDKKLTVSARLTNPVGYECRNSMTITPTVKDLDQSELERRGRELEDLF